MVIVIRWINLVIHLIDEVKLIIIIVQMIEKDVQIEMILEHDIDHHEVLVDQNDPHRIPIDDVILFLPKVNIIHQSKESKAIRFSLRLLKIFF